MDPDLDPTQIFLFNLYSISYGNQIRNTIVETRHFFLLRTNKLKVPIFTSLMLYPKYHFLYTIFYFILLFYFNFLKIFYRKLLSATSRLGVSNHFYWIGKLVADKNGILDQNLQTLVHPASPHLPLHHGVYKVL